LPGTGQTRYGHPAGDGYGVDDPRPHDDCAVGWSVQVPARRAAERDEAAIAAWREETWTVG